MKNKTNPNNELRDKRTDKNRYKYNCWFCGQKKLIAERFQMLDGKWAVSLSCSFCKQFLSSFEDKLTSIAQEYNPVIAKKVKEKEYTN